MGRGRWIDALLVAVLALTAVAASREGARRAPEAISLKEESYDVWFEGDSLRAYALASARYPKPAYHYKYHTQKHPLFTLAVLPPVEVCEKVFGLGRSEAVRLVMSLVAGLWVGTLFLLLRLVGCRRLDALLFTLLASSSASAVFWFTVPETWALGSVTLLIPVVLVAWARDHRVPLWGYVAANAASLSVTVTNWMAGIVASFVQLPWRRAARVTALAFCLVALLWGFQKALTPRIHFTPALLGKEPRFMFQPTSGGPLQITKAFVFHPMLMPSIIEVKHRKRVGRFRMSVQHSAPGSATPWGRAGVWLWAALLGLGVWGARTVARRHRAPVRTVALILLGQFALHQVYGGEETFLYSLHWIPFLVVVAAYSTMTRVRPLALALAGALLVCATVNNTHQFAVASAYTQDYMQRLGALPADPAAAPDLVALVAKAAERQP